MSLHQGLWKSRGMSLLQHACHAVQHCKQNDEKCSLLMKTSSVWSIFLSLYPLSLEMLSKGTLEMLIKGKKYSFSMSWWENGCI